MAGRKITSEREARAFLRAAERSGVTRGEWARDHGVDGRSLNAWRINLERRQSTPATGLQLVELVPTSTSKAAAGSVLRVRCGPFVVEVDPSFDDQVLARLLATVASLC